MTRRQLFGGLIPVLAASPLLSHIAMADVRLQARMFFEPHIPTALRRALRYAGPDGFVASMPQLLHARTNADYDNIIWNTWFTSYSEESVVKTPQGNPVVVAVHGGGILSSPERIERSLHADLGRDNPEGLTGQTAIKISQREARDVLEGSFADGSRIPVYGFAEFKRGIADLPGRYGVVLDFELARQAKRGYERFEVLKDEPNMIVRAGGVEPLAAYLDKLQARNNTELMGNWHPYNRIDPDQPQVRIPFLAGNKGGGRKRGQGSRSRLGLRRRVRPRRGCEYRGHGTVCRGDTTKRGDQSARFGLRTLTTPRESARLNRRRILQGLAATGVLSSPMLLPRALASEPEPRPGLRMVAAMFFDSYATEAFRQALRYAGDHGFVASLPQLLHARVNASYENIIWNTWFVANSEENVVKTPQGNPVVVVVHGGGIFATPKRMERSYRADLDRANPEGLTGQYAAKINAAEARNLLSGRLPDGAEIPLYPHAEFSQGIADLPTRYGVVIDFELARQSKSGYERFEVLKRDPLMVARAGGPESAAKYLDKAAARHDTELMGSFHPFNRIDPNQPQTRLLNLGRQTGAASTAKARTKASAGATTKTGESAATTAWSTWRATSPSRPATPQQASNTSISNRRQG